MSHLNATSTVFSRLLLPILVIFLTGCTFPIAFHELDYDVSTRKYDESVIAVIDQDTLERTVSIRSFLTGIAHRWDARPGQMLKQVADIELPQMFNNYQFSKSPVFASEKDGGLTLAMTIPTYEFKNFHAYFSVHVAAYAHDKDKLFERTYTEEGIGQGAKMSWAAAYGMKSAVRQSSLSALKSIFQRMRADLAEVITSDRYRVKKEVDFGF